MKKSKRLAPVLKLEKMKEQQAVQNFTDSRSQLQQESTKLDQLQQYCREYQQAINREGQTGINAQRLQSYHHFLNRLTQAINHQQQQVVLAEQQANEAEQQWSRQRGATQNMDGLISRFAQQERRQVDKREQRETDEQVQTWRHPL